MAFGLVKHKSKKISARYWKRYHEGAGGQEKRHINVHVMIERTTVPTNTGRKSGYYATACFGGKGSKVKYKKCGPMEFGRTPTIAAKRALVAVGRDSRIK